MREIGHFIGGKTVAGASGRGGDVFNPNTGEVQRVARMEPTGPRQRVRAKRGPMTGSARPDDRLRAA